MSALALAPAMVFSIVLLSPWILCHADSASPQAQAAFDYLRDSYANSIRSFSYEPGTITSTLEGQGGDICKLKVSESETRSGKSFESKEYVFNMSDVELGSVNSFDNGAAGGAVGWTTVKGKKVLTHRFEGNKWGPWNGSERITIVFEHGSPAVLQKAFYRLAEFCGSGHYIFE